MLLSISSGRRAAWLLITATSLVVTAPLEAEPFLKVDFGDAGQTVQAGWEGGTRVGGTGFDPNENQLPSTLPPHTDVTPYGTVTHSINVTGATGGRGLDFRDRKGIYDANYVHPTLGEIGDVFNDMIKTLDYGDPRNLTTLDLIFTGLNAGNYEITTFHHDWFGVNNWNWAEFYIQVEVGAGSGFNTVHTNLSASSNGTDPLTNPAYYTTPFTSPGPDSQITVRIAPILGTGNAGQDELPTNGFVLDIPEPASALLASLGCLGASAVRRRRTA